MKTKGNKSRTIALGLALKADASGNYPTEIQVAKTGSWRTPFHGDFDLTTDDLDAAVENFRAGKYRVNGTEPLPGTLDHNGGESPAAFRITDIFRADDTLWASITWTELGKEKLDRDEYRYISFEYCTKEQPFPNPENRNEIFENVVTGATLTNDPLFKKLKPVLASARSGDINQEGESMDIAAILAKAAADRTEEEKAFLDENKAELTVEQAKQLESETEESDEAKAQREADEKAAEDEAKADEEAAEKLEASTKGMTKDQRAQFAKLQASVKALEAEAQAGREAKKELERTKLTASVKAHADRGAIVADQVGTAVELLMASSEGMRAQFTAFLDALPTNDLLKAEAGHGGEAKVNVEITEEEKEFASAFNISEDEVAEFKKSKEGKE